MAWRFRRSKRLPLGLRLNFSKSGIGYSWGFRGFRIGKDSRGRIVRTVSIPGTGLFERKYIAPEPNQELPDRGAEAGIGVGLYILLGTVCIIIRVATGSGLAAVIAFGIGFLVLRYFSRLSATPSLLARAPELTSSKQTSTSHELGYQAAMLRISLRPQLTEELRKARSASQYELYFDSDVMQVLYHFATLDGAANPAAGQFCLEVLSAIHPRQWHGISAEGAAQVINKLVFESKCDYLTLQDPSILTFARRADSQTGGNHCTDKLVALFYELARRIAFADGPLTQREQDELARFQTVIDPPKQPVPSAQPFSNVQATSPTLNEQYESRPVDTEGAGSESYATEVSRTPTAATCDPYIVSAAVPAISAQASISTLQSALSLDGSDERLVPETLAFLREIEVPLKSELRKLRFASSSQEFLEQDLRALIVRLGVSNSDVSTQAAELHSQLFGALHPKKFSLGIEGTKYLMRTLAESQPQLFAGAYARPLVLNLIVSFDAENHTSYADKIRNIYYRVAHCAGGNNGLISAEKQLILNSIKLALGS